MTDLSKATPRPWTAECLDEETDCWQIPEPLVCARSDGDYLNGANAALIVQAVNAYDDLVETLEDVVSFLTSMIADAYEGLNAYGSSAMTVREQICAALAKAEGGQGND